MGGAQAGKNQATLIVRKWAAFNAWCDKVDVGTLSDAEWRAAVASHEDLLVVYELLPKCAKNLGLSDLERLFFLLRCANLLQRYKGLLESIGEQTSASVLEFEATLARSNSDALTEPYPVGEAKEPEEVVEGDEYEVESEDSSVHSADEDERSLSVIAEGDLTDVDALD